MDHLRQEYVLVQAWKKTAKYIRTHNWYSDTLQLDWTTINIADFLRDLANRTDAAAHWRTDPLRLVPAPKHQAWTLACGGPWRPATPLHPRALRPLAHPSLADQVIATAILLCLADRVETQQRDPTQREETPVHHLTASYGNRLFCTHDGNTLRHPWGSSKLYRSYFTDYRSFLSRPVTLAKRLSETATDRYFLVSLDLAQFYDRVKPEHLVGAITRLKQPGDDPSFYDFVHTAFSWRWHTSDTDTVASYATATGISDLSSVALPQGLVASGFFANVFLMDFDGAMLKRTATTVHDGIRLEQYFRYVDDLRLIVSCRPGVDSHTLRNTVSDLVSRLLDDYAPGLRINRHKTEIAEINGKKRPLVHQSARMDRVQAAVSGGFDANLGAQILSSVFGLIRSQQTLNANTSGTGWSLRPLPDVQDHTTHRFAAGRFRTVYRSIRPLLESSGSLPPSGDTPENDSMGTRRPLVTQATLDAEAHVFSLHLIDKWLADPSNVRLLRIAFDIWPDRSVLEDVLFHLQPHISDRVADARVENRVAAYCLSELFRAGATETGIVPDDEMLPLGTDLAAYRRTLADAAETTLRLPAVRVPWYLRHQAILLLLTTAPDRLEVPSVRERDHYSLIIRYLSGRFPQDPATHATCAVLSRRAFVDRKRALDLTALPLSVRTRTEIARRDPSFAMEIVDGRDDFLRGLGLRTRMDLSIYPDGRWATDDCLAARVRRVLVAPDPGVLRDESVLLPFAIDFLGLAEDGLLPAVVTPRQIILDPDSPGERLRIASISGQVGPNADRSTYKPPDWCAVEDRWRLQLGFLLRYVLTGGPDFTATSGRAIESRADRRYSPVRSGWLQRIYATYNRREAFGGDWIPISDWFEGFLRGLMRWPGVDEEQDFAFLSSGPSASRVECDRRLSKLHNMRGSRSGVLCLPQKIRIPRATEPPRGLSVCVVQTTFPRACTFEDKTDLTLSDSGIRKIHRRTLSSALSAVVTMLRLREAEHAARSPLDLLILPELSVHPNDVHSHLVTFARAYGVAVLAGITYQHLWDGGPLVNSALWIVPERSRQGLQVRSYRQGKKHLSPQEQLFPKGGRDVRGFRPCQWILNYPLGGKLKPLRITAAVCYDATDLALAYDLRHQSDGFVVPALNRSVAVFDNMSAALNYHMYQLVIVANSGEYGGSSAYWPSADRHRRRLFHLFGANQATVAFVDIPLDELGAYVDRGVQTGPVKRSHGRLSVSAKKWQEPPAGWKK